MHNYRLIRQLVACQLGTTSAEISRNSQLGYGQMRPWPCELRCQTELSQSAICSYSTGCIGVLVGHARCADGTNAIPPTTSESGLPAN
jgi:hypothetical protein